MAANKALTSAINGAALFNDYRRQLITGTAQFYLAMSRYRQGRDAESRGILREATASMKPLPANPEDPLAGTRYFDDQVLWLACREAHALLEKPENSN